MDLIKIRLPDGSEREIPSTDTYHQVVSGISQGLARVALAVQINNDLKDLTQPCSTPGDFKVITPESDAGLDIIRHSTAHILAMAVQRMWPGTQVTIGPVIKNGFFYDFAFPDGVIVSENDLGKIEDEMRKIVKEKHPVTRQVLTREDALALFKSIGEYFKQEIIEELPPGEEISLYHMGPWFDLCRGPHIPDSGKAGAFKLTAIAGAYWRGDETKAQLTRIYGTAWASKKDLDAHLERLEEAKRRDHRLLGKQLDLFSFQKEAPANAFFHPKGAAIYQKLMEYIRASNLAFGFQEIQTPIVMDVSLWHKSGHYENYRDNMYFTKIDDNDAAIKPMNCPGHCLVFGHHRHSYRELPLRYSEFGRVHRHERSGVTHGLFRVRTFIQDDAHIFCTVDQIQDEIKGTLAQIKKVYGDLGFPRYKIELSTRPEKSIGTEAVWQQAEAALEQALQSSGIPFQINPGDGAFYGPKIDFHLIDSLERSWQCGTVQLDFSMPERFDLTYQGSDDQAHTPVMIHRAVLGSFERFLGILIEHTAGHFPLWMAPLQAKLITIGSDQDEFAHEVANLMRERNFRVDLDLRNEKLGYKIREAQLEKIPYMVVIGKKEAESKTLNARLRDGTQLSDLTVDALCDRMREECKGFV